MRRYNLTKDVLVEIKKPRRKQAVWGVRNGSTVAYVYDMGKPKGSWEHRYSVGTERGGEPIGSGRFTNSLSEAKGYARMSVKGRAFRSFIRRMGRGD